MDKVIGENEGDALTVDPKLGLEVPQKVAKINVEQLTGRKGQGMRSQKGRDRGCDTRVEPWSA